MTTIDFNKYLKDSSLNLSCQKEISNNTNQFNNLIQFIENNSNVTQLQLEECNINIDQLKLLVGVLKKSNITALNIRSNNIGDEGAAKIAELSNLTILNIADNKIGYEGAAEIAKLSNLTNLNIANNKIGHARAAEIAQLSNLTILNIANNNIGEKGAAEIAKLSNLTNLNIANNNIVYAAAKIAKLSNLTNLNIYDNEIDDEDAAEIAKLSNLTNLNIGWNNLSAIGAAKIAELTNLTELNIAYNKIGDKGAAEIAKLSNLTILNIEYNKIYNTGADEIAKLTNLTELNISNNFLNYQWEGKIAELLNLSKLEIKNSGFNFTVIEKLSNLINCEILYHEGETEIIKFMQNANNPEVNLTHEEVKNMMFTLHNYYAGYEEDLIKYIINHLEKYPFAINSRDAAGHSLLHFYNDKPEIQKFLFENGIIPEQKQQDGIMLRLVQDNQSVHTKEAVDLTNFTTGKLVEDYKGTKESLQEIATAYNNKLKDSTNFFNTPVKLALLSLTDASKRDTMGNALKSDQAVPDDQKFVNTITNIASKALTEKYLVGGYSTNELRYDDNTDHIITIPESLGLVKSLIDTMEIPVADKRELLVTLMVKFPELVKDKLKIIQEKLGIDVPLKVLVNSSNCHKFLESNPIIQKTPQIISELFKDISNLDIEETLREQKEFALAVGVYMAATTYGDMTACILGTWSQIINSATEINPEFLNKFNKLKEEEAKKEKERTSITESNIQDFNNELAKKLIEFVKEKPELQESLAELGAAMIDVRKPQDITTEQQKILAQVNTQFMKMIKDYLPNCNSIIPKFEEYKTIIDGLAENKALQQFVTHYYDPQDQVGQLECDIYNHPLSEVLHQTTSEQDVGITGDTESLGY